MSFSWEEALEEHISHLIGFYDLNAEETWVKVADMAITNLMQIVEGTSSD